MNNAVKGRDVSVDLVKIVAMFGVVCLHSVHFYISENSLGIADLLYESAVVSIPLFFLVSGFLLLGRKDINATYVLRKISGIIRFVFIIAFFYWLFYSLHHGTFEIRKLLSIFLRAFIQRGPLWMFWYFGAMIIIYMLLPVLNTIYTKNKRFIFCLITFLFLIMNVVFTCNILSDGLPLEANVIQPFRLYTWLFYFLCGGIIKKMNISVPLGVVITLFICNILYERLLIPYMHSTFCEYYYTSFIVVILSICFFLYIKERTICHPLWIKELSKLFLPVYTLHVFTIKLMRNYFLEDSQQYSPMILFILCCVVTIVISYWMMKIPYMNKIFRI